MVGDDGILDDEELELGTDQTDSSLGKEIPPTLTAISDLSSGRLRHDVGNPGA
jgi:hypothetical protein